MAINYNNSRKLNEATRWLYVLLLTLITLNSCQKQTNTWSLSEKEYHYNERLSALSSDKEGYWVGSETGVVWYVNGEKRQRFDTGLDRIYDLERDSQHPNMLWIASRNAGLQLWEIVSDTLIHCSTYDIPCKGNRYSPYDVDIADSTVFIATSQGLYAMPTDTAQTRLTLLFPSARSSTANRGEPFLVNSLCHTQQWLFAATQNGVVVLNLPSRHISMRHQGQYFRQVAVYDGKLYCLSDRLLTIEQPDGKESRSINLPQPVLAFYKVGATYYFVYASGILLSEDLHRFVNVPLYHKIPSNSHKIVIPDDGTDFSVLLTENAVWHIPHHLGVLNGNASVIAACCDNGTYYYVNSRHELFRQQNREKEARKIYDFEKNDLPSEMCAMGNDIFYYNANNQLCRLTIGKNYLINQLFARSKVLYQPKTGITTMVLQAARKRILLGVQDKFLSISTQNGRIDTITCMNDKYITAFYQPQGSDEFLLSTLNHGVFVGSGNNMRLIPETQKKVFINSVVAGSGNMRSLILLTNHQLQIMGGDSLRVDGCSRIFAVNDSIIYTLPETGIHKYIVRGKRLTDGGTFFADIRFNFKASFVQNGSFYVGSDLGVLRLQSGKEEKATWIAFNGDVPNLRLLGLIIIGVICIIITALAGYIRQRRLQHQQLQARKDDLHHRLATLSAMHARLNDTKRNAIDAIKQEIDDINTTSQGIHTANKQIAKLSARIARLNRDAALKMVHYLNEQIERINQLDVYDCPAMIEASERARKSEEIEEIQQQCSRNEVWINHIEELEERLEKFRRSTEGALILPGLNDGMEHQVQRIMDDLRCQPLAEIYKNFIYVKKQYENIFTEKGFAVIQRFVTARRSQLQGMQHITSYSHMANALLTEISEIERNMDSRDRILLLRSLKIIDERMKQMQILQKLQTLMQMFMEVHERVVKENEERRIKKFDLKLFADINSATRDITHQIAELTNDFFISFNTTDNEVSDGLFRFTAATSQQVRVLALLIAMPKVKRTLLPGMLGMYGNLNPVVSRLYHSKIGDNREALETYCTRCPASIVHYILKLSE